jgi:hypothetical protein
MEPFRDQVFYREMVRLREEQRSRIVELRDRPSNVISLERYRQQQAQRLSEPTNPPPLKPAS